MILRVSVGEHRVFSILFLRTIGLVSYINILINYYYGNHLRIDHELITFQKEYVVDVIQVTGIDDWISSIKSKSFTSHRRALCLLSIPMWSPIIDIIID
jgi:hypothetical protein